MTKLYQKLSRSNITADQIKTGVKGAVIIPGEDERSAILKSVFSCIDLTSLNITDNTTVIRTFAEKTGNFKKFFHDIDNVAAICVFPNFIEPARKGLNGCDVKIAVVSACFPTSQTFLEVKIRETEIAVRNGADEIDIVMPVGLFIDRDYEAVIEEIKTIRQIAGDATMKVILETGVLHDTELIYRASVIAMEAGADFIKTSTGKSAVSATPEAAWVMCRAIHDYYNETGIMIGFKPAGGISSPDDAITYYNIVKEILGNSWLDKRYFRIGASRLANAILRELYPEKPDYF